MTYALSAQLAGHASDVRAVAATTYRGYDVILTGSRDRTARLWVRRDGQYDSEALGEAEGYINAVAFASDDAHEHVFALTGGQDALISAYEVHIDASTIKTAAPSFMLIGHSGNVSAIAAYRDEYIVSGSWDNTAIVWRDWQPVATLRGHAHAVWAVLPVDSDRVLTASADKTVCLWSISKPDAPLATFTGATMPVRGLASLGDTGRFAAAGNDGTIRIYPIDATGEVAPLAMLSGSPSFVYALATSGATIFSSGEERALRIWTSGSLAQTLRVPAESVWSVAALGDDVVCGSSDGMVRVFSPHASRRADPAVLAAYADAVAAQTVSSAEVEGVPTVDRLEEDNALPNGARCLLKTLDGTLVYERQGGEWCRVGVVADAAPARKTMHNGREYDYVFDVDVQDGVPPLKLAYNASENPYVAAQRFLDENELPASYLDQVVQFLEKNTSAVRLSPTAAAAADPFTGGGSYVSAAAQGAQNTPPPPASQPLDPYTGGSRTPGEVVPQTAFLSFSQTNFAGAARRIAELGATHPIMDDEKRGVDALIAALQGSSSSSSSSHVDTSAAVTVAHAWPAEARLPLLDLLRIAALRVPAGSVGALIGDLFIAAEWDSAAQTQADDTNAMLALRGLANAFSAPGGAQVLAGMALETLATLKNGRFARLGKSGRVAYATVLYNFSVVAQSAPPPFEHDALLLSLIDEVLADEPGDSEVVYRALVALGNLLYASPRIAGSASQTISRAMSWSRYSA
ncbi:hypothetical protein MCUN1_002191 [Malassezia cuniculi]|uniref:Phospholipase A-2-activating protein n=1 Tax=Malassezia cuniculi TaxID=948313 RepID=A0AAF0J6R6_9BASI|nr:hypothetical protein MCUN1_002191 [Malassezia cuniculi]